MNSKKKTSLIFKEEILFDKMIAKDQKIIELLKSLGEEFDKQKSFYNDICEGNRLRIIQDAEWSVSALWSGFDSFEKAKEVLKDLIPKYHNIDVSDQFIDSINSTVDRTVRKEIVAKAINIAVSEQIDYCARWFDKLVAVRGAQGCPVSVDSEIVGLKREFGLLCICIQNIYKQSRHVLFEISNEKNPLFNLYLKKGHDLETETQYLKYKLIELTKTRELLDAAPRIIDNKYQISIDFKGVNKEIYQLLLDLKNKFSFTLSLRPNPLSIYDKIEKRIAITEELEYGKLFEMESLDKSKLVTKLYNVQKDHLWVKIEPSQNAITFEEILDDFPVYQDCVVTSVFHMQYKEKKGKKIIDHFDHEYIIYTIDQFAARKTDASVKGEGLQRVKTFKIDNGQIPFDVENILLPFLLAGFKNKKLIWEYFNISGQFLA